MNASAWVGPLIGACFVGIFFVVGIVLIIKAVRDRKKAEASAVWPSTAGTVTESTIEETYTRDEDGHRETHFKPVVRYTYQVVGSSYTGNQIAFGGGSSSNYKSAQQTIAAYPVGAQVTVYYNPEKPEEAVLERRAASSKVLLIVGIVFLVVSLCAGVIGTIGFLALNLT
jgi:hypothetical protein